MWLMNGYATANRECVVGAALRMKQTRPSGDTLPGLPALRPVVCFACESVRALLLPPRAHLGLVAHPSGVA